MFLTRDTSTLANSEKSLQPDPSTRATVGQGFLQPPAKQYEGIRKTWSSRQAEDTVRWESEKKQKRTVKMRCLQRFRVRAFRWVVLQSLLPHGSEWL